MPSSAPPPGSLTSKPCQGSCRTLGRERNLYPTFTSGEPGGRSWPVTGNSPTPCSGLFPKPSRDRAPQLCERLPSCTATRMPAPTLCPEGPQEPPASRWWQTPPPTASAQEEVGLHRGRGSDLGLQTEMGSQQRKEAQGASRHSGFSLFLKSCCDYLKTH